MVIFRVNIHSLINGRSLKYNVFPQDPRGEPSLLILVRASPPARRTPPREHIVDREGTC